ncbi:DUF1329 domain-containing protein [Pseudomonas sp.]|uniref:DUF1329 domain-containing protein n=1 Tax=Pseudomonas sp. TaxID=306 RepID=UPI002FCC2CDA
MKPITFFQGAALTLTLLATGVMAAVSQQEADQLGTTLTPLGAQKEGNSDGSIPAWTGGLKPGAAKVEKGFLGDPFADEKPLFVINAQNAQQYKDKLTDGQMAMFKRYPDSYRVPVYTSHRTASNPQEVYDAAKKSALNTEALAGGNYVGNLTGSRFYAFPLPKTGVEVLWNHISRYRGKNFHRLTAQAAPQTNGSFTAVELSDEVGYPQYMKDADGKKAENVLFYYKQEVTAPSRLAGGVTLVHETIDQVTEPRMAWVYNAGQRRVRRAPQVAYDGPGTAADGLRTADNADMFNGAPDRYDWKLVGKKEMYIPYNNYRMASPQLKYKDMLQAGHMNPDYTRYELHRVWEVVATLKPGERNIYAKRHMYFDEDTWQLVEIDHYDGRGQLWRVSEGFAMNDYEQGLGNYAAMAINDLVAGRYLVMALANEAPHGTEYGTKPTMADFTPGALRNAGIR